MKGFKIVREDHIHHGFVYQEGLNIDTNPFQPGGSCVAEGLHFFTDISQIYKWLSFGVYLYKVEVPEGYQYVQDRTMDKYRAEALVLSNPLDLRKASTWGVIKNNILASDIRNDFWDYVLEWAVTVGCSLDLVRYIINTIPEINFRTYLYMSEMYDTKEIYNYILFKEYKIPESIYNVLHAIGLTKIIRLA